MDLHINRPTNLYTNLYQLRIQPQKTRPSGENWLAFFHFFEIVIKVESTVIFCAKKPFSVRKGHFSRILNLSVPSATSTKSEAVNSICCYGWSWRSHRRSEDVSRLLLPRFWPQCWLRIWRGFLRTFGFLWERPDEGVCSRVSSDGRRQPKKKKELQNFWNGRKQSFCVWQRPKKVLLVFKGHRAAAFTTKEVLKGRI